MREHLPELVRPERVPRDGDGQEESKQADIEREDDDGDVVQPVELVGEVLEEDGCYARAHVRSEPSALSAGKFSTR